MTEEKDKAEAVAAPVDAATDAEMGEMLAGRKRGAMKFLQMIADDDSSSDSDAEAQVEAEAQAEVEVEAQVDLPGMKLASAVEKSAGCAEAKPAPASHPLRRTRSSTQHEENDLARAIVMSTESLKPSSSTTKRAAKDKPRSSEKNELADKTRARKKASTEKMEKRRRRVQSPDMEEDDGEIESEPKSKLAGAKMLSLDESRRKKAQTIASRATAAVKRESREIKKLRERAVHEGKPAVKRKSNEDTAPSKASEEIAAPSKTLVTPSPTRKRSRAVVSSASSAEAPRALTEDQHKKKELRRIRSAKLQKRRMVWKENQEDRKELLRAYERRDRAASGARVEDESTAGDRKRELSKTLKRKGFGGVEPTLETEKDRGRKVLPHKKRRRLQDASLGTKALEEATRDAKRVTSPNESKPVADGGDNRTVDTVTTSQEGSAAIDEEKEPVEDSAERKPKRSTEDASSTVETANNGSGEVENETVAVEEAWSPASLVVAVEADAEEGQVCESSELKKLTEEGVKSEPEVAEIVDLPIPKKSLPQSNALGDLPIPRRAPLPPSNPTTSFVIPKRSVRKLGTGGSSDETQVTTANDAANASGAGTASSVGAVVLSSSRMMVRKPRVAIPDILKAVVQSAPSALVRPARRRTKQQVPSEIANIKPEEREFVKLAKRRRSLVAGCLSTEEFARGPTPYEVFDAQGSLLHDLTPRLTFPSLRHLRTNRDDFPPTFFGVGLTSPKVNVKSLEEEDAKDSVTVLPAPNYYEPLVFARPEDREAYQRKMYGTSFVPQMIKGHTTLIMRNARYERKSRGIRFNSDRDREDYAQVLSQRFKKNKSVPMCEIPRDSWRKMMVEQRAGFVYLHYYNREDAMLAALEFVDDNGIPLEWKREYRAGVVLNANVSPAAAPRRSRSNDRSMTPSMSPEGSQYGSDRDRDRDFRSGRRRDNRRGPPPMRERGRYGEPMVMQRSPSGIDNRASFATPTNSQSDRNRDRDADRSRRGAHSRSRSRPRSRSRSHSIHAAAPRDASVDRRRRLSAGTGESDRKAGRLDDDSACNSSTNGNGNTGESTKASQDGNKSAESDGGGTSSIECDFQASGDASKSQGTNPTEERLEAEPGELPIDEERNKESDKSAEQESEKQRSPYPNKSLELNRSSEWRRDPHRDTGRGMNRYRPSPWQGDGRPYHGGRSRSRERPRNPEPRRDWGRDERGPPPSMSRDYDPHRHGGYAEHGGRERGGGYQDSRYRGNRHDRPPPPPPPRDMHSRDRRRY